MDVNTTRKTRSLPPRECYRCGDTNHIVPVFNVDGFPNEAGQISKVMDIVLRYKTHSKRMLLAVSRLRKQSLILDYNWLKDHNPKID